MIIDGFRRADLHDPPLAHDRNTVGKRHRFFLVVRDNDEGRAARGLDALQFSLRFFPQFLVESAERLVQEQHLGIARKCPGERHALALATRELMRLAVRQRLQLHEREHLLQAPRQRILCKTLTLQAEGDVSRDRQMRKERVALEHHVHWPEMRRNSGHILPIDGDGAAVGRLEARDHPHQRGLAAARGAKQRKEFATTDLQRDTSDGPDAAEALAEVTDGNRGRRRGCRHEGRRPRVRTARGNFSTMGGASQAVDMAAGFLMSACAGPVARPSFRAGAKLFSSGTDRQRKMQGDRAVEPARFLTKT